MKDRTTINQGLTINQLCHDMYPNDVDKDGFPTHSAKTKIRSIFHQIRKINPDCLFFSVRYRTRDGRLEWRYLNLASQEDVDDVIARLTKMAEGIERTEEQIMAVHQKGIKRRKKQIKEWEEEVINEARKDSDQ